MSVSHYQHALRRPHMRQSPDQWLPLANAASTIFQANATDNMMLNNITLNDNNNTSSSETFQEVPDASGTDLTFRLFLVVLFCLCAKPQIPDERYHRRRRTSEKEENPKVREKNIEQSLTVKRVVTADVESGGLTLGEPLIITDDDTDTDSDVGDDHTIEDENEETSTCIICLEPFRVGDTVAWSKQSTIIRNKPDCVTEQPCLHVFHHDCIVPWLTNPQHDDCPACRSIILQDSVDETTSSIEEDEEDLEAAPSIIPFVIIRGMVSRVHHASCSLIGHQSVEMSPAAADCVMEEEEDDDDNRLSSVI